MAIIVKSPFSGKDVKVRDNDAGRAVKDEEGRIFYVLPKSDGSGYYGSITRSGSGAARDESRNEEMEDKVAVARGNVHENVEASRGGGGGMAGKVIVLVFILAVLGFGAWVFVGGGMETIKKMWSSGGTPPPAAAPSSQ